MPESSSCTTGLDTFVVDELTPDDHKICCDGSNKTIAPLEMASVLELWFMGWSWLAVHMTISGETMNHMPTNQFVDLPGLKKPKLNMPPDEARVWPFVKFFVSSRVSSE